MKWLLDHEVEFFGPFVERGDPRWMIVAIAPAADLDDAAGLAVDLDGDAVLDLRPAFDGLVLPQAENGGAAAFAVLPVAVDAVPQNAAFGDELGVVGEFIDLPFPCEVFVILDGLEWFGLDERRPMGVGEVVKFEPEMRAVDVVAMGHEAAFLE